MKGLAQCSVCHQLKSCRDYKNKDKKRIKEHHFISIPKRVWICSDCKRSKS